MARCAPRTWSNNAGPGARAFRAAAAAGPAMRHWRSAAEERRRCAPHLSGLARSSAADSWAKLHSGLQGYSSPSFFSRFVSLHSGNRNFTIHNSKRTSYSTCNVVAHCITAQFVSLRSYTNGLANVEYRNQIPNTIGTYNKFTNLYTRIFTIFCDYCNTVSNKKV